MERARWAMAAALLFMMSLLWSGFVHLVLLADANATLVSLRRADADALMPLSVVLGLHLPLCSFGVMRASRAPAR